MGRSRMVILQAAPAPIRPMFPSPTMESVAQTVEREIPFPLLTRLRVDG